MINFAMVSFFYLLTSGIDDPLISDFHFGIPTVLRRSLEFPIKIPNKAVSGFL